MICRIPATHVPKFNPWKCSLAQLARAREICLQTLEAHNMAWESYLDKEGRETVQRHKAEIEDAARERFGVRVWR